VIPRESPEEGIENSSRTASSKESALNYRVVVWSEAREDISQISWGGRKKNVRREMKEFWVVGIS